VKNEGDYRLSTNMTVEDLILKADGFKEGAYEYMAVVFRMNNEKVKAMFCRIVYEIELSKDYFKTIDKPKSNFVLQDKDHVVIRKSPYYQRALEKLRFPEKSNFRVLCFVDSNMKRCGFDRKRRRTDR
jgi:protein involved in polysaccharide export with SLBB domain